MAKRQQLGWWFLCLACVVVIVCTAQRMAGLHALQMAPAATAVVTQADSSSADDASPVTPCELSAKSLLAAPPVLFEGAILALCPVVGPCWRPYAPYACHSFHREQSRLPHSESIYASAYSVNDSLAVADC
ncbi:Uncharacterised protein [Citrobacter koseri]|uniref:Copper resistance protein n=1 Tax=Citrobacter koseri TaxID=545 RepID=A0A2X2VNV2_CITKO|nr:Uncharacterised protein [Citrobacter koseri]